MASLQSLLGQSLVQNLGLQGALEQRQQETQQLAQQTVRRGQLEGARIKRKAAERRGLFSTIGTVVGAAGGALLGGLPGAQVGASVGGGLGGIASGTADQGRSGGTSRTLQQGLALAKGFQDVKVAAKERAATKAAKTAQQDFENAVKLKELQLKEQEFGTKELKKTLLKQKDVISQEDSLAKRFDPINTKFGQVSAANQKIKSALRQETAAGDLAGIFSFMKVLDPGSTVREGEFANAQNAAGVPDKIRNVYNQAAEGRRLGTSQRADFLTTSGKLFKAEQDTFIQNIKRLDTVAKNRKLNRENIFGTIFFDDVDSAEGAGLTPGTTVIINGRPAVIE